MTRDLRRYARQTNARLILGFLLLLFLVGDGLVFLVFGRDAAILGVACILLGLAPLLLIALAMWGIDWITRRFDN
jgi:hypothetical protein